MTTTDEILCQIEKGGTLDELAKVLDMSKSLLVARIEFLARAGYLS
jgi:DNA-binding IclR family transcriptional regulator